MAFGLEPNITGVRVPHDRPLWLYSVVVTLIDCQSIVRSSILRIKPPIWDGRITAYSSDCQSEDSQGSTGASRQFMLEWRNWIAQTVSTRKVVGSSPTFSTNFVQYPFIYGSTRQLGQRGEKQSHDAIVQRTN